MEITLDFSSKYDDLFAAYGKIRSNLDDIKTASVSAQQSTQIEIAKTLTQVQNLDKALTITAQGAVKAGKAIDDMASVDTAKSNVDSLNQVLSQTEDKSAAIADNFKNVGQAAGEGITNASANAQDYVNQLEQARSKWVEIISQVAGLSDKQKESLNDAVNTASAIDLIAQRSGEASKSTSTLNRLLEETAKTAFDAANSMGEITPNTIEAQNAAEQLRQSIVDLSSQEAVIKITADGSQAETEVRNLNGLLTNQQVIENKAITLEKVKNQQIDQTRQKLIGIVTESRSIAEEQKNVLINTINTAQGMEDLQAVAAQIPELFSQAVDQTVSLRTQIQEAEKEAALAVETFGRLSPQAQEAVDKTAELKLKLEEVKKAIASADPNKKFEAVSQVTRSLTSGFTAVNGALTLVDVKSETASKSIEKLQAGLAISQGLNAFVSGFKEGFTNIIALIQKATAATEVNAAVVEANAGAQTVNAAATATAATAATTAAGAFRAMTAALVANPILAAVAALVLIAGAVIAFGDDTEEAKNQVQDLIKELENLADVQLGEVEFKRKLNTITQGFKDLSAGDDPKKKIQNVKEATATEINLLTQEKEIRLGLIQDLIGQEKAARDAGDEDLVKTLKEREKTLQDELQKGEEQKAFIIGQGALEEAKIRNDANEQAKADYKKRLDDLKRFREDLQASLKDLADRSNQATLERATPRNQIEIERSLALQSLEELRSNLIKKGQLTDKNFKLSLEQEEQFNNLALTIEDKYHKESEALTQQELETKLQLIEEGGRRELETFDQTFKERAKKLKEAGAADEQIEIVRLRERNTLLQKLSFTEIDNEQTIQENIIKSRERGSEDEKSFERRKAIDLLDIQLAFTQARLNLIQDDGTDATALLKSNLNAQLASIRNAKDQILSQTPKNTGFDIFKFLGIDITDEQKEAYKQSLAFFAQQFSAFKNALFAEQESQLDLQKQQNDAYLQQLNDQISATESALQTEKDLKDRGLANDVDRREKDLKTLKQQREEALKQQREINKEKAKLAREQAIIDQIAQASSMGVAVAQLFAHESLKGIPGVIAAAATALGLVGLFLSLKARFNSASKTELEHGDQLDLSGKGVKNMPSFKQNSGKVVGRKHSQGGNRIEGTNIWVEDQEWIVNGKSSNKYHHVINAINSDNFDLVPDPIKFDFVEKLLEGTNVVLNSKETQKMVDSKVEYQNISHNHIQQQTFKLNTLESIAEEHLSETKGLRKDLDKPTFTQNPDGTITERGKGYVKIIAKR